MPNGTICKLGEGKNGPYGLIRPDDDTDERVYFKPAWVQETPPGGLQTGMRVEYEYRRTPQGLQTTRIRLLGEAMHGAAEGQPPRAPRETDQPPTAGGYRFLNPYNFVRYLEKERPRDHVLGDCPPPPHDRYLGLTGRVTCTLEAVTPLFVSDSHEIVSQDVNGKEHRTYRFFEYDGRPAVPASSLRGMARAVYEAVTNSCFSVLDGRRLSYRLEATRAAALVPARVERGQNGRWQLRLLTGLVPIAPGQRPRGLYAAAVHLYDPIEGKPSRVPKVDLLGLEHGDRCVALVEKKGIFTYVLEVGRVREQLSRPTRDTQRVVEGFLCINNQNVENKRKERLFFRANENRAGPIHIELPAKVAQEYEDLIADYQQRHEEERDARGDHPDVLVRHKDGTVDPALSRYMYRAKDRELHEGALVYAAMAGSVDHPEVRFIAPAAVPRVSYERSIGDLLDGLERLRACDGGDGLALCPACRAFGWVYDARRERETAKGEDKSRSKDKVTAYAGRLRFSHAALIDDPALPEPLPDITLAILSSPKPTTTRFYLRPRSGPPRDGLSDDEAGYDGPNVLRGRKFYRHFGQADPAEYWRATGEGFAGRDDQNRTVRGARPAGARFRFTVDFENLAPVELGALLWSLEIGGEGYHRLGFAKPLGFGSVKVEVKELEVLDPGRRHGTLDTDGGWLPALGHKEEWVAQFREVMGSMYGSFDDLANVRDLLALLGEPPALPIHYPRVDRAPAPEGKNFEWFMVNKRSGREAGPRLALDLADEDTVGLPLLDRSGRARKG